MIGDEKRDLLTIGKKISVNLNKVTGIDEKYLYRSVIGLVGPSSRNAIRILSRYNLFLILSTGRTGTMWLANLLNKAEEACVMHEPVTGEQLANVKAFKDSSFARKYLMNFRLREMALRCKIVQPSIYGEVNPALKYFASTFRGFFPDMKIVHVIRDGRDFVRSVMSRDSFTDRDNRNYVPPQKFIPATTWNSMGRFEKICWVWSYENEYLRKHSDITVKFEDIISDYDIFYTSIVAPLNLKIDRDLWLKSVRSPQNTSNRYWIQYKYCNHEHGHLHIFSAFSP